MENGIGQSGSVVEVKLRFSHTHTHTHTHTHEASMKRKGKRVSAAVHDIAVSKLGDNDIKCTDLSAKGAKIDPVLRLFPDAPFMCISNEDLDKGRGNGTLCKFVSVKLKSDVDMTWKNWEGRKVNTVSIDDIEWIQFQHWSDPPKNIPKLFKLGPRDFSSVMELPLTDFANDVKLKVGNVRIKQIPVNSNIATTGHKLQGMSKDVLIVNSWSYGFNNWIYVVCRGCELSRGFTCANLSISTSHSGFPKNCSSSSVG